MKTVLDSEDDELIDQVRSGRVKLNVAAYVAKRRKGETRVSNPDPVFSCIRDYSDEVIAEIARLYLKPGDKVADVTYGKGVFWRRVDTSQYDFGRGAWRRCGGSARGC